MHIVIGFLTVILTLFYVLERLGIDVGWFNPWSWRRRRAWAKRYHGNPIYSVENPIDVAAIFIVGIAKLEGDLSAEQGKSMVEMIEETAAIGGAMSDMHREYIADLRSAFIAPKKEGTWT